MAIHEGATRMIIKPIMSSSKGNCYILEAGKSRLMLEAGASIGKIKEFIDFNFAGLDGVLITHEHL